MSKFTKLKYNEIKTKRVNDFNSSFIVQPLERGMANTIGNSIRRVLLSSVPGVAPFAIKIAGITHPYSPIPNVDIDVLSLIAKLSRIPFKYNEELFANNSILKVSFKSEKEGVLTYNDLNLPLGLEIIGDLNTPIATLATKNALEFDLFIKSDRGYSDEEKNKIFIDENRSSIESKVKGELIAMDSNFSPIRRVAYYVEELTSSSYNIQEKLELEVETNGTIDSKEALSQAAKILISHLSVIGNVQLDQEDIDDMFTSEIAKKSDDKFSKMTIDDLNLTVRSTNGLRRAQIEKVSQLIELSENELRNINSIGEKSVREIIEALESLGIEIKKGDN